MAFLLNVRIETVPDVKGGLSDHYEVTVDTDDNQYTGTWVIAKDGERLIQFLDSLLKSVLYNGDYHN
jgi:hypothetical protein